MNASNQSSRPQSQSAAASRRRATGHPVQRRYHVPLPRSTTRVIWTSTEGATVVYGDVA